MVETLCRTADRSRFDLSVMCLRDTGAIAGRLRSDLGIPVSLVHSDPRVSDRFSYRKVQSLMASRLPDVVHSHNREPFVDGSLAAFLLRVPTVIHTEHGRDWSRNPWKWRVVEGLLSRLAYRIVGVSEETTDGLRRQHRVPEEKLLTIPNGIEGARYDVDVDVAAVRRSLDVPPTAPVVGFASRLESEKNCQLLVRAFARVVEVHPSAILVVAGYGSQEQPLARLAEELGIGPRVRFLGVRDDVPQLLKVFDVHVLCSLREGLPMVILEAFAAGCPTVATAVGGVPSAIRHGSNGELVDSGDEAGLADALDRLLGDAGLRARYAAAGRETFRHRYEADVMTRTYERLYRRLDP